MRVIYVSVRYGFSSRRFEPIQEIGLMEMALNSSYIREQDAIGTLVAVAGNPYGTDRAWEFVKTNFPKLKDRFGATLFNMKRLFSGVAAPFHTEDKLQELEEFSKQNPDFSVQMADAIAETRANVRWVDTNLQLVHDWLQQENAAV
nr:hypothetical protein BaRGS_007264 [Batillaria attramentaria]